MRKARIIEEGAAYYHTMSRVVDRRFVFDEANGSECASRCEPWRASREWMC